MIKELIASIVLVASAAMSTLPSAVQKEEKDKVTTQSRITSGMPTTSANARRWYAAKINPDRVNEVKRATSTIVTNKNRYVEVSQTTGVPWSIISVLHYRESSLSFKHHLHEGSPLTARTKYVPKGRPLTGNPPFTWKFSAEDALAYDGFTKVKSWTIDAALEKMEQYNGLGYRKRGLASPYLFGGTSEQDKGKYVADGKFDKNVYDKQLGTVALLKDLESRGDFVVKKEKISL